MPDILLIDDNKNYSFGLAGNLRKAGFNVVTAHNGQDGIKLANQSHPDLILCDVKMPEMDGMEIKEILNKESSTASIPFVFLSALSAASIKSSGLEMGADDYITKSVDLLELITRIKVCLLYTSPSPRDRTRARMPSSA